MISSEPETPKEDCLHPSIIYRSGASSLKNEDVVFVEHCKPWPGSEGNTTNHSQRSLTPSTSDVAAGSPTSPAAPTLDSLGSQRWLPEEFAPSCTSCGTPTNAYSLYCVFDGHNGVHAAKMAGDTVLAILEAKLPWGNPPPVSNPYYTKWREWVQQALVETMVELNHCFAQRGIQAGATATLILLSGSLVTAVNIGDSRAMLDTGSEVIALSVDHRVATHKGERRRVEAMGAVIAPISMTGSGPADDYNNGVGPLRIWPGGLCLSRAIGDFDVGDSVIPFPHVTQVLLPPTGGRIIVASDGVWDAFDKMTRASTMSRSWPIEQAPSRMIQTIVRAYGGLKDDTSMVIIDVTPPGITFAQVAGRKGGKALAVAGSDAPTTTSSGGGGGCFCFGGGKTVELVEPTQDASVKSIQSNASSSNHSVRAGGKLRALVLCRYDVAALMGLMPETELEVPGWYTTDVGENLFKAAADSMMVWREAHERRYARPPPTPQLPDMPRPKRKSRKVAFVEQESEEGEGGAALFRVGSVQFSNATAESGEEYAQKFGHYKKDAKSSLGEPSVRAGTQFIGDQSVRAGTVNAGGAALRTIQEDPSVRIRGSDMDKSVHMKAWSRAPQDSDELVPVRVVKLTPK